jgi:hypothetical protein
MVDGGLVVKRAGALFVFTDDNRELPAGVTEYRSPVNALNAFDEEGATGTSAIGEGKVLGKAVCVPRHSGLSEPGRRRKRATSYVVRQSQTAYLEVETGGTGSRATVGWVPFRTTSHNGYYFGHHLNCNFLVAEGIWRGFFLLGVVGWRFQSFKVSGFQGF